MKHSRLILLTISLAMATTSLYAAAGVQSKTREIRVFRSGGSYLGVEIREVTAEDVASLNLPREAGVYIESVSAESPAEKAGLKSGDVVLEYSGIPVLSVVQFQRLVSETPAGREVGLKVIREGREFALKARIGKIPAKSWKGDPGDLSGVISKPLREFHFEGNAPGFDRDFFFFSRRPALGISAGNLTEQMAEFLGVPGKEGVLVMEVHENTPAAAAGVKAGDVITAVDGRSVEDPAELSRRLSPGTHELEIVRDKEVMKIQVELEGKKAKEERMVL